MPGPEKKHLLTLTLNLIDMGMYWLKNQRSRADLQKELEQLRTKNLKLRLDLDVVVLTPNSRRAKKIKEDRIIQLGCRSDMFKGEPVGPSENKTKAFFR